MLMIIDFGASFYRAKGILGLRGDLGVCEGGRIFHRFFSLLPMIAVAVVLIVGCINGSIVGMLALAGAGFHATDSVLRICAPGVAATAPIAGKYGSGERPNHNQRNDTANNQFLYTHSLTSMLLCYFGL